jgi:hypothetical protein
MSDAHVLDQGATGHGAAESLAHETARLAGRLATLLEASLAGGAQGLTDGVAFLRRMEGAATARPASGAGPLERLADGLGLAPIETELVLLAGLPEEHEGYGSVLRALHPRGEPRVSVGLAAQLLCETFEERMRLRELLANGAATRGGLLALGGDGPFFERHLLLADATWPVLAGLDVWPASVRPLPVPAIRAGLEEWLGGAEVARALSALQATSPRLVLVLAESEEAALGRATALVAEAGLHGVSVALPAGPREDGERLVALHALARGAVPIVRLAPADGPAQTVAPELSSYPCPFVVAARRGTVVVRGERPVLAIQAGALPPEARRRFWAAALPELGEEAPLLAARYTLEPAAGALVARDVRSIGALGAGVRTSDVADSVRTRSAAVLSAGVKLIRPAAAWSQLVLSADRTRQLEDALARLVHQSRVLGEWGFLKDRPGARGVRMLLVGPPGTGKTLAAEVLAAELGVDLLVVDIARVVSKWLGETEKNLAEVFDAAERSQAVLLFDEADALFGRRTEVSDAHDRYANLETAYLLSRIEHFEGLAVLSTNFKQNIDPAFLRRMEFVIDFEEPAVAERERLWRCHLPEGRAPYDADVRLPELAALYPVVGGLIRNAAVAAAFLAAAEEKPAIRREHIVRALRREYAKSGKAFPEVPAGLGPFGG